jgi:hypothetical protein
VAAFLYQNYSSAWPGTPIQTVEDFVASGNNGLGDSSFAELLCPENLSFLATLFGTQLTDPGNPTIDSQATALAAEFARLFGVTAQDETDMAALGLGCTSPGLQAGLIPRNTPMFEEGLAVFESQILGNLFEGDEWSARIDWNSGNNRLFGEWYWQDQIDSTGGTGPEGTRGFISPFTASYPIFRLSLIYTLSPTVVNDLRGGYNRSNQAFPVDANGPVPYITFGDGSMNFGTYNGIPQFFVENILTVADMVSITKGKHNIKAGVDFRRNEEISEFNVARPSMYFFDQIFFAADAPALAVAGVDPGLVSGGDPFLQTNFRWWRNNEIGLYIQDDWKVAKNLTLNIGLRYDNYTRHKERFDRETTFIPGPGATTAANGFFIEDILNANIPGGQPGCDTPEQLAGRVLAGVCGPGGFSATNRLGEPDQNNFGPRFGVAWDPFGTGKTVIRGGAGISYEGTLYNPLSNSRWNPPFYSFNLAFNWLLPLFGFDVPLIYGPGDGSPITITGDNPNPGANLADPNLGQGNIMGWDPSTPNQAFLTGIVFPQGINDPIIYNFHFGFQHEFVKDTVLEVNYVGTQGRSLFRAEHANRVRGSALPPGMTAQIQGDTVVGLGRTILNPNYGTLRVWANESKSWYNALQVSVRKALSQGLMFNFNYTWAHSLDTGSGWHSGAVTANGAAAGDGYSLDNTKPLLDKGNSTFDIRHRVAGSWVYELPFGRDATGAARHILGGWQLNGSVTAQTGAHWTPFDSNSLGLACTDPTDITTCTNTAGDYNLDGIANDRPDVGNAGTNINATTDMWANGWFNVPDSGFDCATIGDAGNNQGVSGASCTNPAFAIPGVGHNGNFPRNGLEGPGQFNIDFSLFKNFSVTEQVTVQFRWEVFNAFNRTNFLLPNGATGGAGGNIMSRSAFGQSDGTLDPRQMQFALKVIW